MTIDIGVLFEEKDRMDTSFMDKIIESNKTDYNIRDEMSNEEFDNLLLKFGINPEEYHNW